VRLPVRVGAHVAGVAGRGGGVARRYQDASVPVHGLDLVLHRVALEVADGGHPDVVHRGDLVELEVTGHVPVVRRRDAFVVDGQGALLVETDAAGGRPVVATRADSHAHGRV